MKEFFRNIGMPKYYLGLLALVFLATLPLWVRNPFFLHVLIIILFHASLASAWNILGGFAGQLSLGHASFYGIGAYTSTLLFLNWGVSPWIGMLLGGLFSAIVSLIIGYPCFRLKGPFFSLATIAIGEVMRILAIYWRGLTQGSLGLLIPFKPEFHNFLFKSKEPYYYFILILMLTVMWVSYKIYRSRLGYHLISLREDEDAAQALGVNTAGCKLIAISISAFFTAIAGVFYAQYIQYIDPYSEFSLDLSVLIALFAIIGGIGTIYGPIIGAFLLTPIHEFLRAWLGGSLQGLHFLIYAVVLIVVVILAPAGLIGWLRGQFERVSQLLPIFTFGSGAKKEVPGVPLPKPAVHPFQRSANDVLLEINGLTKSFGGLTAVKNVDLCVKKSEIVGLVGPNGAGKTTIFNLICNIYPADSGKVLYQGENLLSLASPYRTSRRGIGRTFQIVKPFGNLTTLENVMIGSFSKTRVIDEARENASSILKEIGLLAKRDFLARNLTIADRKRLELGKALATQGNLLLLDEVIAGLNPKETDEMIVLIREIRSKGWSILMIEHVMQAVMNLCDRLYILHHGEKIAEGSPSEIVKNELVIKAYLGRKYEAARNR